MYTSRPCLSHAATRMPRPYAYALVTNTYIAATQSVQSCMVVAPATVSATMSVAQSVGDPDVQLSEPRPIATLRGSSLVCLGLMTCLAGVSHQALKPGG